MWKLEQVASQQGRVAIVTGANIGLGYETALALASKGCNVVMACRNLEKANTAKQRILALYPKALLDVMALDVSDLKSVRAFAQSYGTKYQRLDLLINNAGIMMPPFSLTVDGFESQLGTNYLGHFALTGLLLPLLQTTPESRIVSLSSLAHLRGTIRLDDMQFKNGYSARDAYGQSKLACLMFSYELDRRLRKAGSTTLSVAAHPGISDTNLTNNLPMLAQLVSPVVKLFLQPAAYGALPTLYAALGDGIAGGDYFGPDGFLQVRGHPVKVKSNSISRDTVLAGRLWALSETLTNTHYLS